MEYTNMDEIRAMLNKRKQNLSRDGILHTEEGYNIMKEQMQPIDKEPIKLIKYNRENNNLENLSNEKIISMICNALDESSE